MFSARHPGNSRDEKESLFKEYYTSHAFKRNIWLPEHAAQHHFRVELFTSSNERVFRRVRKSMRTKEILSNYMASNRAASIYFTPIKWLHPIYLRKSKKKFFDCMLSSPLYFDIDKTILTVKSLKSAFVTTKAIIDFILEKYNRKAD